ncbi:Acylpeptide hydrolase [Mycena chlorophos]|uniref:acylaminoacyl-peptidase n=1 Tax=Mycena chlorophos TaxID=658473 RepID=A0A8H6WLA7_MYCCL|nr:Acylpeptide hydrolase [Mycena chlorophos]
MANAADLYQRISALPTYTSAVFGASDVVNAKLSSPSYDTFTSSTVVRSISTATQETLATSAASSTIIDATSPDGATSVVFRSSQWLEVFSPTGVWKYKLDGLHGQIYTDPSFGPLGGAQLSWDASGTRFLYVAETLVEDNDEYVPDFGDSLTGKRLPAIFLVDIVARTVKLVVASPTDGSIAYGQPVFTSPTTFVAVGYGSLDDGRRVGLIYCQNRLARLFRFDLTQDGSPGVPFTPEDRSARSARVGHGFLVYLSNAQGGPHGSVAQLHARPLPLDLSSSVDDVVIPAVVHAEVGEYPGLYLDQLPPGPFLLLGGRLHVVLSSAWRSRIVPLLISLEHKMVTNLAPAPTAGVATTEELASYRVLRTDRARRVVATRSSLNRAPELVLYDAAGLKQWSVIGAAAPSRELMPLALAIITVPNVLATEIILLTSFPVIQKSLVALASDPTVDCVYVGPQDNTGSSPSSGAIPPVIHVPHGGPHMSYNTGFRPDWVSSALSGYTVCVINYTGSTGFGLDSINALCGRAGDVDVHSVRTVYDFLIEKQLASAAPGKQFIEGISHGGFLTAHMTSKYPTLYHGASLRNPAIDFAALYLHGSDIPEWAAGNVNLYTSRQSHAALPISIPNPGAYEKLASASPIHNVSAVIALTLIQISEHDRRIHPTQGLAWYHGLRGAGRLALGTELKCKIYKGEIHEMDGVEAEWKVWKASVEFYNGIASWD